MNVIGKALGAKAVERQIAATLHRNGISPTPKLVKELTEVFNESYEL